MSLNSTGHLLNVLVSSLLFNPSRPRSLLTFSFSSSSLHSPQPACKEFVQNIIPATEQTNAVLTSCDQSKPADLRFILCRSLSCCLLRQLLFLFFLLSLLLLFAFFLCLRCILSSSCSVTFTSTLVTFPLEKQIVLLQCQQRRTKKKKLHLQACF